MEENNNQWITYIARKVHNIRGPHKSPAKNIIISLVIMINQYNRSTMGALNTSTAKNLMFFTLDNTLWEQEFLVSFTTLSTLVVDEWLATM